MVTEDNQNETNLSPWKYFTDDAEKIKDRMWTMASCMFNIQASITAFITKHLKGESLDSLLIETK